MLVPYKLVSLPTVVVPLLAYTCTYTSFSVPEVEKCMYCVDAVAVKTNHCSPPDDGMLPSAHWFRVSTALDGTKGAVVDVVNPIW